MFLFFLGCFLTLALYRFSYIDSLGNMTGIVSERDYVCKVALLGRTSNDTPVKEISTRGANIITATEDESVDLCMEKMMNHGTWFFFPFLTNYNSVLLYINLSR